MEIKKGWKASILNFLVPGLGHVYGREVNKGVILFLLFFFLIISLRFVAYNFYLFLLIIFLLIGYYLYLIINGYRSIGNKKEFEARVWDKWYLYFGVFFIYFIVTNSFPTRLYDKITPIGFARVTTTAMDPALQVGDILAYEKTKNIKKNDVALFWFPLNTETLYVKRCIGLPGDSLEIRRGVVYINNDAIEQLTTFKFKYLISSDGTAINERVFEKLLIKDYKMISPDEVLANLTPVQASALKELGFIKKVERLMREKGIREEGLFPNSPANNWNTDFYGPVYIPKKGDLIELNKNNIGVYAHFIKLENDGAEVINSEVMVNGKSISSYEFKENYYFMMGDNRHDSYDSRYWGFLPESLMEGKAMYFNWSENLKRIGNIVI